MAAGPFFSNDPRFQCFSAIWGQGGAGCFGEVAALHSDHHRQVPL